MPAYSPAIRCLASDHHDLLCLVNQLGDALDRMDTARFIRLAESIVDRLIAHMQEETSVLVRDSNQAVHEYNTINRAIELQGLTLLSILE